jgi:hypothetical protein
VARVVLHGAAQAREVNAAALGQRGVHRHPDDAVEPRDVEGDAHPLDGDPVKERLHVAERADADPLDARLGDRPRVVGVEAEGARVVVDDGEAGDTLGDLEAEPRVGVARGAEAAHLAACPEPPAIHVAMDAARVRELAGVAEVARVVEPGRVLGAVERPGREARPSLRALELLEIGVVEVARAVHGAVLPVAWFR